MKFIAYNTFILNSQEEKYSKLDHELLGIVHALPIDVFQSLDLHIQFKSLQIINLIYTLLQNNAPSCFYHAQMQRTNLSKLKIIHKPGKSLSVTDMSLWFLLTKNSNLFNSNIKTSNTLLKYKPIPNPSTT